MSKNIKISVIVPAFNCEDTIEECLDSILLQSMSNIELIVIDDGSIDNTYELVKRKAAEDSRVIFIRQENAGPSAARNRGIEAARGEFLNFVDSDDIILAGMFDTLILYQAEYEADLVISGIRKLTEKKERGRYIEEKVEQRYYFPNKNEIRSNFIKMLGMGINSPVGRLYRTEIVKKNNIYFNELLDMGEDLHFNIQYIDKASSILFVPDIFYQYNTFNSILTSRYRQDMFNKRKKSVELLEKFLDENEIEKNIIYYLYIKLVYATAMQEIEHKSNLKKKIQIIGEALSSCEVKDAVKKFLPKSNTEKIMYRIVKLNSPYLIDIVSAVFVRMRKSTRLFSHRVSV